MSLTPFALAVIFWAAVLGGCLALLSDRGTGWDAESRARMGHPRGWERWIPDEDPDHGDGIGWGIQLVLVLALCAGLLLLVRRALEGGWGYF